MKEFRYVSYLLFLLGISFNSSAKNNGSDSSSSNIKDIVVKDMNGMSDTGSIAPVPFKLPTFHVNVFVPSLVTVLTANTSKSIVSSCLTSAEFEITADAESPGIASRP